MSTTTPTEPVAGDDTGLFDPTPFEMKRPKLDGYSADKLVLAIGGTIGLLWQDQDDVEFMEEMRLGQDVKITIVATVVGKGFGLKTSEDDETATFKVNLKAHTIEREPVLE